MRLRDYQESAVSNIRLSFRSHRAIVFVLPTGAGKSAIASHISSQSELRGKSVLFLAPRRELIYQISDHFQESGVDHGTIMAGEPASFLAKHQIACIPSLHRRAIVDGKIQLPRADLVIVDEAHIGVGGTAQELIQRYKDSGSFILGLTATPARTDGRGLGEIYDDMVMGPTVQELIDRGHLVRPRYFRGSHPDMEGVKIQAGDYHQAEAGKRADDTTLIGDVVSNWARLAGDRQTFVFCASKAHSRHLCQRFRDLGVAAEHIDSDTETEERREIQKRLRSGETQVICNVEVMTYGVDFPPVSCIVLAKPTKSVPRLFQMIGRGLRPSEGKDSCYVLDHANATRDVGFVEDDMPWSLDGKEKVQDRKERTRKEPKDIECPSCGTVFRSQPYCPACGHELKSEHQEAIKALEADLEEIDRKTKEAEKREWSVEDKARFFGMLKGYAIERGYKKGWAVHSYKQKFGVTPFHPPIWKAIPEKPDKEVQGWIQHLNIKRAKKQQNYKKATPEQIQGVKEALDGNRQ